MTIHKAKGLEFPVVIFPYADVEIYKENKPKVWLPVNKVEFCGFDNLLINFNQDVEYFGENGANLYQTHTAELELDNINLLYVALTRAIEQLFIITRKKVDKNGNEKLSSFGGLFINYLKNINEWDDQKLSYEFGNSHKSLIRKPLSKTSIIQKHFLSTPKKKLNVKIITKSGYLWDTSQEKAIEKGNIIHLIMSLIKTIIDVEFAFDKLLKSGVINEAQVSQIKPYILNIINHPQLKPYFNNENIIYNERDILLSNGDIIRPDRVIINQNNNAIIIDYKTGQFNEDHFIQISNYKNTVSKLGLTVEKAILVYVNDEIEIKEV